MIIFINFEDFENKTIKKTDLVIEERAYEVVRDWYVSEKRHFLSCDSDDGQEIKVEVYGKEMPKGYVAIIPSVLKKVLEENKETQVFIEMIKNTKHAFTDFISEFKEEDASFPEEWIDEQKLQKQVSKKLLLLEFGTWRKTQ